MALLRRSSRSRNLSAGVFFVAMFLAGSFLPSVGLDQAGFLQSFFLIGIHDERSFVSSLKRTATLQEQANGAAVLPGLDFYCRGHGCSLLEADIRPETSG